MAIFACASGYLATLIPLHIQARLGSNFLLGLLSSVYYLGLLAGSFHTEKLVVRVGHIRCFAGFTALLGASLLLMPMLENNTSWLVLRFINGIGIAGVYVSIESWLLADSNQENRGRLLAIYMISLYGASAVGQLFISYVGIEGYKPFLIIGLLLFISVLPPSITKLPVPEVSEASALNLVKLFCLTPSGMLGAFVSGIILGSLYGFLPVYLTNEGTSQTLTGHLLGATILGGMLLQYPVGKLSDYLDRRWILVTISALGALVALVIFFINAAEHVTAITLLLVFLGGATFTLYPVSISHACDHLEKKDIVAGCQALLLSYSVGSCLGPLLASMLIGVRGGLMIFFASNMIFLAIFFILRTFQRVAIVTGEENAFIAIPGTTPVVAEIDPRGQQPDETEEDKVSAEDVS